MRREIVVPWRRRGLAAVGKKTRVLYTEAAGRRRITNPNNSVSDFIVL